MDNLIKIVKKPQVLLVLVALVLIGILAWEFQKTPSPIFNGSTGYSRESEGGAVAPSAPYPTSYDQSYSNKSLSGATQKIDRKVIKTGSVSVIVEKADVSLVKIKVIAEEFSGFIEGSNIYDVSEDSKAGYVVVKVPADKFDEVVARIKSISVKVETESSNSSDVTEEFIDTEARLRNFKAQESQYLKILSDAIKIEDILNVTSRLNETRDQIERTEARIKYLSDQVAMATITVNMTEEGDVQLFGVRWRPLFTIKQAARNLIEGLKSYTDSVISFLFVIPLLVIWIASLAVTVWVLWKIILFGKNRIARR